MTVQIGRSIPRLEERAKVTGRAEYAHNLRLPGMLYGKVFRSTVAHGRIRAIDTGAAAALDGVIRVVTGEDIRKLIPSPYYGPAFHDQPILTHDKVRCRVAPDPRKQRGEVEHCICRPDLGQNRNKNDMGGRHGGPKDQARGKLAGALHRQWRTRQRFP
jgi:CO/xanthine dehydrogenase Mo-binding subunit